jgi:hypothetical protein
LLNTLIKETGKSGKAVATALAPESFVRFEVATKNSLPINQSLKINK